MLETCLPDKEMEMTGWLAMSLIIINQKSMDYGHPSIGAELLIDRVESLGWESILVSYLVGKEKPWGSELFKLHSFLGTFLDLGFKVTLYCLSIVATYWAHLFPFSSLGQKFWNFQVAFKWPRRACNSGRLLCQPLCNLALHIPILIQKQLGWCSGV